MILILILILFHGLTDVEDKFVFLVAARPGVAHEIECQIVLADIFGCVELQLDVGLALEKLSIVSSLSLFEYISLVLHVNCSKRKMRCKMFMFKNKVFDVVRG